MRTTAISARPGGVLVGLTLAVLLPSGVAAAESTGPFSGVKVNGGSVMHQVEAGTHRLTLSDDFRPPDAPDVHWQLVDSQGRAYLLQRLATKNDGQHRTVEVPAWVPDVARVQMWCAFAETLLGEAAFPVPVKTGGSMR